MGTLRSSCSSSYSASNFISESYGNRGLCSARNLSLSRPQSFRFPWKRHDHVRLLHLVSIRYKIIKPVCSWPPSASSSPVELQVNSDVEETQIQDISPPRTVHVKFQLQKQCLFGEHFFIVGDDSVLGLWDPENAVPLVWSEGHVWSVELDMPVEKSVHFKFILKDINGRIVWQPGPDRILETVETNDMITVSEGWEYSELGDERLSVNKEEESVLQTEESDLSESIQPLQEMMTAMVAENITFVEEQTQVNQSLDVRHEKQMEPLDERREEVSELVTDHEGALVLVPGLPPSPVAEAVEKTTAVEEETPHAKILSEANEKASQLDKRHERNSQTNIDEAPTATNFGSRVTRINRVEEKHHRQPSQEAIEEEGDEEEEEEEEREEQPEEPITQPGHNVVRNDIQWGQRTLQKLLGGFGLL